MTLASDASVTDGQQEGELVETSGSLFLGSTLLLPEKKSKGEKLPVTGSSPSSSASLLLGLHSGWREKREQK